MHCALAEIVPRVGRDRRARRGPTAGAWLGGPGGPALPTTFRAFSLLEVVAAVGIFAVGMVAVLALFTPVTKSVATVSEAEAAARVADAVIARLQAIPFATALALVQDATVVQRNDAAGNYNPNDGTHPAVIYGKLDGELGLYDASATPNGWFDSAGNRLADGDKYFEIELIRNEALSPSPGENSVPPPLLLAFSMRVRWPAWQPGSNGVAVQVGANPAGASVTFDHSKKSVLFFTGSISR